MTDLIDDHELQRLLDGSLPEEDRVLLLEIASDHPENWRCIALAFIEEQVLRNELKEFADLDSRTVEPVSSSIGRPSTWTKILCQAAVVCMMLGAAAWVGRISVGRQSDWVVGNESVRMNESLRMNEPRLVNDSFGKGNAFDEEPAGNYTIVLPPQQPSFVGDQRLVSTGSNPQQDAVELMLMPLFDQQSQGVFRDHGYTVNEEPVIYVVQGQGGEQYVVPHRNVSFVAHRD